MSTILQFKDIHILEVLLVILYRRPNWSCASDSYLHPLDIGKLGRMTQ